MLTNTQKLIFGIQPSSLHKERAFYDLAESTEQRIQELHTHTRHPIHLICHSFGAHLALQSLNKTYALVASCTLISTGFYFKNSFLLLLKTLSEDQDTPADLKAELQASLAQFSSEISLPQFWKIFSLIIKDPHFMRLYWPQRKDYNRYLDLASQAPPLKREVFQQVANHFLELDLKATPSPYTGPRANSSRRSGSFIRFKI